MKKLLLLILLTMLCASISKITAQNKPFAIQPEQVKNVYTGLVQNDSLRNRLQTCEQVSEKLDSIIRAENKKTIGFIDQINKLNTEANEKQAELNKSMAEITRYEKIAPAWIVSCLLLGIAGGLYLGGF